MHLVESTNRNANIIMQEFIAPSKGMDLNICTLGDRTITYFLRRSEDGGFKANFSSGSKVGPYKITLGIKCLATQTSNILNLDAVINSQTAVVTRFVKRRETKDALVIALEPLTQT